MGLQNYFQDQSWFLGCQVRIPETISEQEEEPLTVEELKRKTPLLVSVLCSYSLTAFIKLENRRLYT